MRRALGALALAAASGLALASLRFARHDPGPIPPPPATVAPAPTSADGARPSPRGLQMPTGAVPSLRCDEARLVIAQARGHLASVPEAIDARDLADATADWLDPHGLWSAAPDAPVAALLRRRAFDLLHEIEALPGSGPCRVAEEAGARVAQWVAELGPTMDAAARAAGASPPRDAFALAVSTSFEDHAIERPARELARELGRRLGALDRAFGAPVHPFVASARARLLPSLDPDAWSRAILAAAVRAYLPLVDPHGGWAPLDEETALYEIDLEASPPPRLWSRMSRSAVGVVPLEAPLAPVEARDLVLEVGGVTTGGLSVEQLDQLAVLDDASSPASRSVIVLREGAPAPVQLEVALPPARPTSDAGPLLPWSRVRYGEGEVLVIAVGDVPDDLGDLLAATVAEGSARGRPEGVVLDLRGNGGGSTDGANAALGMFLPGVPLFPLRRRDGEIEVERAAEPPESDRWTGPLAVMVDGDSASAAEMIAGALASYHRATVAGSRTYGKGCAQEYLDDDARRGVLRLSTLVYALPDGSPVQRVGLVPQLSLGFREAPEREAHLSHTLATWRGPDVRDPSRIGEVPWPAHHGRVGPCDDDATCRLLRALGATRAAVARGRR